MWQVLEALAGRKPGIAHEREWFRAAVLVPLMSVENAVHVLFEVRADGLPRQPGEICFPGGEVEDPEEPARTALREACEELGLTEGQVELLGCLDYVLTPPGILVYPFAGRITPGAELRPNPGEVREVFTVPFEYLLDYEPAVYLVEVATRYPPDFPFDRVPPAYGPGWQKRWAFPTYFYEYRGYLIWGITARILHNLLEVYRAGAAGATKGERTEPSRKAF